MENAKTYGSCGPMVSVEVPTRNSVSKSASSQVLFFASASLVFTSLVVLPYAELNRRDRGCGDLVSLVEYSYGAVVGLPTLWRWKKNAVPWKYHFGLLVTSLGKSWSQNAALTLGLPIPLFLVIKNGGLLTSMLVGLVLLQRRYSMTQKLAVALVTVGVLVATFRSRDSDSSSVEVGAPSATLGLAAMCLLGSMLAKSIGGACQEMAMAKSIGGACQEMEMEGGEEEEEHDTSTVVSEMLFYQSLFAIPLFLFKAESITSHWYHFNASEPEPFLGSSIPILWLLVLANCILDRCCKECITRLISHSSSLTATMVLTLSRLISICATAALNAPPWPGHMLWIGCAVVVGGSAMYHTAPTGDQLAAAKKKK